MDGHVIRECLYMGIMYLQIIIFMAFMISKTLELEKTQRTAVVYWGVAGLSAFFVRNGNSVCGAADDCIFRSESISE